MPETSSFELHCDGEIYQLSQLSEFGFKTARPFGQDATAKLNGTLLLGDDPLPINFRVRDNREGQAVCSFAGITLEQKSLVKRFLENKKLQNEKRKADRNEDLTSPSNDQLAAGFNETAKPTTPIPDPISTDVPETNLVQPAPPVQTPAPVEPATPIQPTFSSQRTEPKETNDTAEHHMDSVSRPEPVPVQPQLSESSWTDDSGLAVQPASPPSSSIATATRQAPAPRSSQPVTVRSNALPASESANKSPLGKTFALLLVFTLIGLSVLALSFMKSRSTLGVSNSALAGNCLPVNARVSGEIIEVLVQEGDAVKKGDLLIRLHNPEIELANEQFRTEMVAAETKVSALNDQRKYFNKKLEIAAGKLKLDLEVAQAKFQSAKKSKTVADSAVKRLEPYVASGAVSNVEFDAATSKFLAFEAQELAQQNLIRQIEFSQEAAKSKILILGGRLDAEMGRIEAELKIAKADFARAKKMIELTTKQLELLEIRAPRDGLIFATYRQQGEFLRTADEVMAIGFPGKTWARGLVTEAQAGRVQPGQPVTVKIPSYNLQLSGVVSAVGHRALDSKDRYSATFRGGTATDVPVKVVLKDLPKDIPSGMRLDMDINTGYGIKWLDDQLGYQLQPISDLETAEGDFGAVPDVPASKIPSSEIPASDSGTTVIGKKQLSSKS